VGGGEKRSAIPSERADQPVIRHRRGVLTARPPGAGNGRDEQAEDE
jgi:hypothetical protein